MHLVILRLVPQIQIVLKTVKVPQVQFICRAVDVPVVGQRQVFQLQTVAKQQHPHLPHSGVSNGVRKKERERERERERKRKKRKCESGCAYHGITDSVTNTLMKVQHVAVSEKSVTTTVFKKR